MEPLNEYLRSLLLQRKHIYMKSKIDKTDNDRKSLFKDTKALPDICYQWPTLENGVTAGRMARNDYS